MQSSIVAKLLSLLSTISETRKPLTFSEIVSESGLNKSTIHRLLAIGKEEKLVQFDEHRKVYLLGSKIFDLVRGAYGGYDIQAIALDEMIRLHSKFDGNVTIGVPSGMEVVYLRILEAKSSLNSTRQPGTREPPHCSATGKALLAYLPDKVIASKLGTYSFDRFTHQTITEYEGFVAELETVRQNGFAANDREQYDHVVGIAVPIFNYMSEPIAVLNIWCDQGQHPYEEVIGWASDLKAAAGRITSLIGGTAPDIANLKLS
jgi:DNA-binding IclR family transcriptional regulator